MITHAASPDIVRLGRSGDDDPCAPALGQCMNIHFIVISYYVGTTRKRYCLKDLSVANIVFVVVSSRVDDQTIRRNVRKKSR